MRVLSVAFLLKRVLRLFFATGVVLGLMSVFMPGMFEGLTPDIKNGIAVMLIPCVIGLCVDVFISISESSLRQKRQQWMAAA